MSETSGYTAGLTSSFKKLVAHPEILKLITHEAAQTDRTMTEVSHLIFCAYFKRDPSDPTKKLKSPRIKAAS